MTFNAERYQGHWCEVGRQNAPFEAFCAKSSADYTLITTGCDVPYLKVVNHCFDCKGAEITNISGKVTAVPCSQGVFNLVFDSGETGIYRVLYTDYDHFSFVGNLTTGYLSILSRCATVSPAEVALLRQLAGIYGFKSVNFVGVS